jgi:hypothetical protein
VLLDIEAACGELVLLEVVAPTPVSAWRLRFAANFA